MARHGDPVAGERHEREAVGLVEAASLRPAQAAGRGRCTTEMVPDGSIHSGATTSGNSLRMIWSVVQLTVATVGMPRRW